jgi:hypothetical protein
LKKDKGLIKGVVRKKRCTYNLVNYHSLQLFGEGEASIHLIVTSSSLNPKHLKPKNPHTTPPLAFQLLALSIVCLAISMVLRKFLFFAQFVTILDIG